MAPRHGIARPKLFRRLAVLTLIGTLLSGASISMEVIRPPAAQAVTNGAGLTVSGLFVGNYINSGTRVYCAELGLTVSNSNISMGASSSLAAYTVGSFFANSKSWSNISVLAMSGTQVQRMNYILNRWGNTTDNATATAVQLAIWTLRAPGSNSAYTNGSNTGVLDYHRGLFSGQVATADWMISQAATYAGASGAVPSAPLVDPDSEAYSGAIRVYAGTTSVTADNAYFIAQTGVTVSANGKTATITDGAQHDIQWVGVPPAGVDWTNKYTIEFNATYSVTSTPATVQYGNPASTVQAVVRGNGTSTTSGSFSAFYWDPSTIWVPEVSTSVPAKFVQEGEMFSDRLYFSTGIGQDEDGNPVVNPWRRASSNGGTTYTYAPIYAKGTLYGPFASDPALTPSLTVPVGAPVAGTASFTTPTSEDPTTKAAGYPITTTIESLTAGYYTWVWEIDFDDQIAAVTNPVGNQPSIPEDYYFTDGFGTASEIQVTPTKLQISTQLVDHELAIGEPVQDEVTATADGFWLNGSDDEPIPYVLRGSYYFVADVPVQAAVAPVGASLIGSHTITVDEPGEAVLAPEFTVPASYGEGYVTVQWCLVVADQPLALQGFAVPVCDDWGIPAETAKYTAPTVTTLAMEAAAPGDPVTDTATVTGPMPAVSTSMRFRGYWLPVAGQPRVDSNFEVVVDGSGDPVLWTQDDIDALPSWCDAQPVGVTAAIDIDDVGEWTSPELPTNPALTGTLNWVHELLVDDGTGIAVIGRGVCGEAGESTTIEWPVVTTQAQEHAWVGGTVTDTALVSGTIATRPGVSYTVSFEGFVQEKGTRLADEDPDLGLPPVCLAENRVFQSSVATDVTGVGEFSSEKFPIQTAALLNTLVYWQETLTVHEGGSSLVVHTGVCGANTEWTQITADPSAGGAHDMAGTGRSPLALLLGGLGAAFLVAAGLIAMFDRHTRRAIFSSIPGRMAS